MLLGGGTTFREKYEGKSIPHTFYLDREGRIVRSRIGEEAMATMESIVRRILKQG